MCVRENTARAASVDFVRHRRTNYARSRPQAFCRKNPEGFSTVSDRPRRRSLFAGISAPASCKRTPHTPQVSLHQPSSGPPPFRQGRVWGREMRIATASVRTDLAMTGFHGVWCMAGGRPRGSPLRRVTSSTGGGAMPTSPRVRYKRCGKTGRRGRRPLRIAW